MDYVYYMELPDDITPERLLELGLNFEYRCLRSCSQSGAKREKGLSTNSLTFAAIFRNAGS